MVIATFESLLRDKVAGIFSQQFSSSCLSQEGRGDEEAAESAGLVDSLLGGGGEKINKIKYLPPKFTMGTSSVVVDTLSRAQQVLGSEWTLAPDAVSFLQ